jgi:hypothetical protein
MLEMKKKKEEQNAKFEKGQVEIPKKKKKKK